MHNEPNNKPVITEPRSFKIPATGGESYVGVDVNWNKNVFPCTHLRFKIGNKTAIIKKSDLVSMLMLWADPTEREKLIQKDFTNSRHYETILGVKATKKIEQDESINIAATITVPSDPTQPPRIFTKPAAGSNLTRGAIPLIK